MPFNQSLVATALHAALTPLKSVRELVVLGSARRVLKRQQSAAIDIHSYVSSNRIRELLESSLDASDFSSTYPEIDRERHLVQLTLALEGMSKQSLADYEYVLKDIKGRLPNHMISESMTTLVRTAIHDHVTKGKDLIPVLRNVGDLCPEYGSMTFIVDVTASLRSMMPSREIYSSVSAHLKAIALFDTVDGSYLLNRKLVRFVDTHPEHVEDIINHWNLLRKVPSSVEQAVEMAELGAVREGWL